MKIEIGAFEAKLRLLDLLQQVRTGKRFTIAYRGEAIADLIPTRATAKRDKGGAVARFQAFIHLNPVTGKVNAKALKKEGRE